MNDVDVTKNILFQDYSYKVDEDDNIRTLKIVGSFDFSRNSMNIWGGDFAQKLISYHLSDGTFTKSDLDFFITETEKHFKNFAVSQKEFADLPKEDQDILLAENIPLFVNFVLSNYIMADSGLDQIVWILGPRAFSHASSETNSRFKNKSPQTLNKDMSMFLDVVQWTRFQDLACLIKKMNFRYEKADEIFKFCS